MYMCTWLYPGGQMILCVNVIDDLGQHCGKTRRAPGSSLFDYLAQPWKEMIQEGRITQVNNGVGIMRQGSIRLLVVTSNINSMA